MKLVTARRIVSNSSEFKDSVYYEAKKILNKKRKQERQNRKKGRQ